MFICLLLQPSLWWHLLGRPLAPLVPCCRGFCCPQPTVLGLYLCHGCLFCTFLGSASSTVKHLATSAVLPSQQESAELRLLLRCLCSVPLCASFPCVFPAQPTLPKTGRQDHLSLFLWFNVATSGEAAEEGCHNWQSEPKGLLMQSEK